MAITADAEVGRAQKRPTLLFYCQHSLGMGHLLRSFALVRSLARVYRVVFLNGGPLPAGLPPPSDCEMIHLPPLGMDADGKLVSRRAELTLAQAQALRRERILALYETHQPQVMVIELFPFGRKKFAHELMPLLQRAREGVRPVVLCSLRDILVNSRSDQAAHDDRASTILNKYFDAVLVHADPSFVRLDESFRPRVPVRIAIEYTGFVAPAQRARPGQRERQVVVSVGGGMVGAPLLFAAIAAQPELWAQDEMAMTIVAGPFLPESEWREVQAQARGRTGLTLLRSVPDLTDLLCRAAVSVSQCGYNTSMDILRAEVPALVVPFATAAENEQMRRARRLEDLGAVRVVDSADLDAHKLAAAVRGLLTAPRRPVALDLDGAERSRDLVRMWADKLESGSAGAPTRRGIHEHVA